MSQRDCRAVGEIWTTNGIPLIGDGMLYLVGGSANRDLAVPIAQGRAMVALERADRFGVGQLIVNGSRAPNIDAVLDLSCGGVFDLRVPPMATQSIEVLIAEDGAAVVGATAIEFLDRDRLEMNGDVGEPWPGTPLGERITGSPNGIVALPSDWGGRRWFVGAPGRSWKRYESKSLGGQGRVILAAAGRISISVLDWGSLATPTILASLEDGRERAEIPPPMDGEHATLGGLTVGNWQVRVVDSVHPEVVYAESSVVVRSGETSVVSLSPRSIGHSDLVPVALSLHVPPEWADPRSVGVRLLPVDGLGVSVECRVSVGGKEGMVATAKVRPGDYLVSVRPLGWQTSIRVGRVGLELPIEIPPPVSLDLSVIDSESGLPVPNAIIFAPGGAGRTDLSGGTCRLRVPRGKVDVAVEASGYAETSFQHSADGLDTVLLVKLERLGGLSVRIRGEVRAHTVYATGLDGAAAEHCREAIVIGGLAVFDDLPPGNWQISLESEDEASVGLDRVFKVRPGVSRSIEVEPVR